MAWLGLLRDRRGIAAVEFAFCAPIFILLLVAGADMLRYYIACDRAEAIARSISLMLAQNDTGTVTYRDVQFYHDSAMLTYPALLTESYQDHLSWFSKISISAASVIFAKDPSCTSGCPYVPSMVWAGGDAPRSCDDLMRAAADTDPPSPTTLPQHVFAPGSIVVVDVVYTMKPLFQNRFFSGLTIKRSSYESVRLTSSIKYNTTSDDNGIAHACSAYASG